MQPGDNLVVTSADHHQHVAVKLGVVLQWMQQALEVSGTIQCSSSKQDLMLSLVCLVNFSFTQKSLCLLMDCSPEGQLSRKRGKYPDDGDQHLGTWKDIKGEGTPCFPPVHLRRRGSHDISTTCFYIVRVCDWSRQATDAHSPQVDAISVVKGLYQLSPHLISCNVFAACFFPKYDDIVMHNWYVCMCILYTYFQL